MEKFNRAQVELEFEFVALEGRYMTLIIDGVGRVRPNSMGRACVQVDVELPGRIMLHIGGKTSRDTVVADDGSIIADKCIKLTRVRVDRVRVNDVFLKTWPRSNTNIRDTYFGFNGAVELEFASTNSFKWLLSAQHRQ
jgi:hypothetical protein